jgi:inorganic pyrophosphatase/exopolyphosphatase
MRKKIDYKKERMIIVVDCFNERHFLTSCDMITKILDDDEEHQLKLLVQVDVRRFHVLPQIMEIYGKKDDSLVIESVY